MNESPLLAIQHEVLARMLAVEAEASARMAAIAGLQEEIRALKGEIAKPAPAWAIWADGRCYLDEAKISALSSVYTLRVGKDGRVAGMQAKESKESAPDDASAQCIARETVKRVFSEVFAQKIGLAEVRTFDAAGIVEFPSLQFEARTDEEIQACAERAIKISLQALRRLAQP